MLFLSVPRMMEGSGFPQQLGVSWSNRAIRPVSVFQCIFSVDMFMTEPVDLQVLMFVVTDGFTLPKVNQLDTEYWGSFFSEFKFKQKTIASQSTALSDVFMSCTVNHVTVHPSIHECAASLRASSFSSSRGGLRCSQATKWCHLPACLASAPAHAWNTSAVVFPVGRLT